ncbi:MAG: phosphoribosyl-ATP diphosphatase, partial [Candidatus Peribacteraceae bacterium]|nr:phosphoribosyl-ATP diphosphatase [Candidatus Peribacteraceae bacterium]
METADNRQLVLVPKAALDPSRSSRNRLVELLVKAGYDRVLNGFDRRDEIAQDTFVFRGVKGAEALASQLELLRDRPVGIVMGADVLAEADLIAQSYGVRSGIQRLLSLGVGSCSLTFLAPEERPLLAPSDLRGRRIFTKYPLLLRRLLQTMGLSASVRRTEGADTRVNESRGELPVAAFEIVESGRTARESRLQISGQELGFPSGEALRLPYLSLPAISTDLSATRVQQMTDFTRDALRELGLALESARQSNRYVALAFNVPTAQADRFRDLGLRGPTAAQVLVPDGAPWSALEIYVPIDRKNAMRAELLCRGARDLSVSETLNVELSTDQSEVLRVLPFELIERGTTVETGIERDRWESLADVLLELARTVRERAQAGDSSSGTFRALQKGTEFCVGKCMEEFIELLEALPEADRAADGRATEEAADLLYRLLVALRSR